MQGRKSAKRTVELIEPEIASVEAAEVAPSFEDLNAEIDFKHAPNDVRLGRDSRHVVGTISKGGQALGRG
jgi:hypothetical protein